MKKEDMLKRFERNGYKVTTDINSGHIFVEKNGHRHRYFSLTAAYNYLLKTTRL